MAVAADDVAHLCRRAGFGATAAEIKKLSALGSIAAVVERILTDPRNLTATPVESPAPPTMSPPTPDCSSDAPWQETHRLGAWFLKRMVDARFIGTGAVPHPVREKLTLFLHGLLVSSLDKDANYCAHVTLLGQHRLFRKMCFGDYADLLREVSRDPAMLLYLDNWYSVIDNPNENYARELMELFSIGVGNYTQDDVVAVARAGTGYSLNDTHTRHEFHGTDHDGGADKTYFGLTGNWDLVGTAGGPPANVVITQLCGAKQALVAKFIGRLLWQYYAHFTPSDAVLADVAAGFTRSGKLVMMDALRTIFNHPEFYGPTARAGKVKNPVEWMVVLFRGLNISFPMGDSGLDDLQWSMEPMNMVLFRQPNVFGWWRRPETKWIGLPTIQEKASFGGWMISRALDNPKHPLWKAKKLDPAAAVSAVATVLQTPLPASSPTRTRATALVTANRAGHVGDWWTVYNLALFLLLSPEQNLN